MEEMHMFTLPVEFEEKMKRLLGDEFDEYIKWYLTCDVSIDRMCRCMWNVQSVYLDSDAVYLRD